MRRNTRSLDVSTDAYKQSITWPCQNTIQHQIAQNNRPQIRRPPLYVCSSPLAFHLRPDPSWKHQISLRDASRLHPCSSRTMVVEVVKHSCKAQPPSPNQVFPDVSWAGVRQSGQSGAKRGKARRGAERQGGVWRSETGTKRSGAMWTLFDKMGNNT